MHFGSLLLITCAKMIGIATLCWVLYKDSKFREDEHQIGRKNVAPPTGSKMMLHCKAVRLPGIVRKGSLLLHRHSKP